MESAYASEIRDQPPEALNSRSRGVGRNRPGDQQFSVDCPEQDLGRACGRQKSIQVEAEDRSADSARLGGPSGLSVAVAGEMPGSCGQPVPPRSRDPRPVFQPPQEQATTEIARLDILAVGAHVLCGFGLLPEFHQAELLLVLVGAGDDGLLDQRPSETPGRDDRSARPPHECGLDHYVPGNRRSQCFGDIKADDVPADGKRELRHLFTEWAFVVVDAGRPWQVPRRK